MNRGPSYNEQPLKLIFQQNEWQTTVRKQFIYTGDTYRVAFHIRDFTTADDLFKNSDMWFVEIGHKKIIIPYKNSTSFHKRAVHI